MDKDQQPFDGLAPYLPPHLARSLTQELTLDGARVISIHLSTVRAVLSTYLPAHLVESIAFDPTPGRIGGQFRTGAVMFADVSGFTAMSEKLSVLGKEGAEEITRIVNDYFSSMLAISERYGGDLLKFGGDALLLFFEGDQGPERALTAALSMQDEMARFTAVKTSQGVFPLRMKIGMSYGPIFLATLGTPEKMEYAVMGKPLAAMGEAEEAATAGQIVVDRVAYEKTKELATFLPAVDGFWLFEELLTASPEVTQPKRERSSPVPLLETEVGAVLQGCARDAEVIASLSPFVPSILLSRIIANPNQLALFGSHRPVTVMFANFFGHDVLIDEPGPADEALLTGILNDHFVTMSEVITRYGGTVARLDAYGTGHRILALFGALRTHEDDPQRAVRAALEMNKRLAAVNERARALISAAPEVSEQIGSDLLKQRIGINSGFVFAANTGSETRREYTVMGDQVNLTARLMSASQEGDVLLGQSTAKLAENTFVLDEKAPLSVKGIARPVRSFVAQTARERSRREFGLISSPIIGRDQERQLGRDAIERVLQGQGRLILIHGVSGMGKTRLAEEIIYEGRQRGMDVLIGTCLSYGETMTYHPWAELLRSVFGLQTDGAPAEGLERQLVIEKRMAAIGEAAWTPVIGLVMGLEMPDNELTRDLDPKLRRQRVLDLTVKLLNARARQRPLIIMIEDAHWADPASLELINYVARNTAGESILFILPYRPDTGLPEWHTFDHALDMELADLPESDCRQIVKEMLGNAELPEPLYEIILGRGSGNPFFIGEVVRALVDSGFLAPDNRGVWRAMRELQDVDLPDTIHGIIMSRIDRLQSQERRTLRVASVIGRVFAVRILDGVYLYDDLDTGIAERLKRLGELGITEVEDVARELYRFIHLTTREVVYESLSFQLRRSLHRSIGQFIEHDSAEAIGEQTDLLAYHYYEGREWLKAMVYNLQASRHAQREFANETAILSGERALSAAESAGQAEETAVVRRDTHETMGEVLTLVGRYDEALEHFGQAREVTEGLGEGSEKLLHMAELCRKTAEVYERRSEYDVAFDWLHRGLGYLDEKEPTIEAARIYLLGTGIFRRQGNNDRALEWCKQSLDISSQLSSQDGQRAMAQAYYTQSGIHWRRGELDEAVKLSRRSISIYDQIGDIVGLADAYNNLSIAFSDLGEWDNAIEFAQRSLEIKEKIGDIFYQAALANNLAEIYRDQGKWEKAISLYEQSNVIWRQLGATLFEGMAYSNLAQVEIYRQKFSEAGMYLIQAQGIFAEAGSDDFLSELERRWGEFYLRTGRLDQALSHMNKSIRLASDQEARFDEAVAFRLLGEVEIARSDFEAAGIALRRSLHLLEELGSDYEAARTMVALTELALAIGQEINRDQLDRARQVFEKLGAEVDLRQTISLSAGLPKK